jgi:hypothetical protein
VNVLLDSANLAVGKLAKVYHRNHSPRISPTEKEGRIAVRYCDRRAARATTVNV